VLFRSILFGEAAAWIPADDRTEPVFFRDLNLDQIIASVTAGKNAYDLTPFFYGPLKEIDAVVYRQEVFQDLENRDVHDLMACFAQEKLVEHFTYRAREMRDDRPDYNHYHRARSFLNSVEQYCAAVTSLSSGLTEVEVRSRGLLGLRDYLANYVGSDMFTALQAETSRLEDELDAVRYCVLVKGNRITVGPYGEEADYGEQVTATFERFQQGAVTNYLPEFRDWDTFAAAGVLHLVAKVYPDLFAALDAFCRQHSDYLDDAIRVLDRELQFYLSYLDHIRPLRRAGLTLSYPRITASKEEQALDTFDLALAAQLTSHERPVVCNDITLTGPERILVVSGPNNGGKTTLARTFGQLHYLARLGCPVPGDDVRLFLCDQIFTHFEKEEDISTLAGKLQDELNRLKADFERATSDSVIILNEVFNSTTAQDALFLSRQILEKVTELDALCVCVTFLDELASLNEKTVSMVATVVPDDPATRTHTLIRKPADGRAYAQAIADKYGLTFERLTEELTR
jgi:DNA mismatch repair protein MutS